MLRVATPGSVKENQRGCLPYFGVEVVFVEGLNVGEDATGVTHVPDDGGRDGGDQEEEKEGGEHGGGAGVGLGGADPPGPAG